MQQEQQQPADQDGAAEFDRLEVLAGEFEPLTENDTVNGTEGAEPAEPETSEVLLMVISPLADILAPKWAITQTEKNQLAGVWAPVIDKWFGGLPMGPEVTAIAITAMIVAPRLGKPRKDEPEPEEEGDAGTGEG